MKDSIEYHAELKELLGAGNRVVICTCGTKKTSTCFYNCLIWSIWTTWLVCQLLHYFQVPRLYDPYSFIYVDHARMFIKNMSPHSGCSHVGSSPIPRGVERDCIPFSTD